jgi:hypothetical protein
MQKKRERNYGKNTGVRWMKFGQPMMLSVGKWSRRILVGIPMTGSLRAEWVLGRYHQIIPCNWSQTDAIMWLDTFVPLGFTVADARNILATQCVEMDYEWLFFIDHDVILPASTVVKMNDRMIKNEIPLWSGLYWTKSKPSEPLVYRGRGNGYFPDWKMGDEVWVDGLPMGCTMISVSLLKTLYDESPAYKIQVPQGTYNARRFFQTPGVQVYDPVQRGWFNWGGTEDLDFCARLITEKVLQRAGWEKLAKKKYPFLIDTSIFCKHIDPAGIQYPSAGEEGEFEKGNK